MKTIFLYCIVSVNLHKVCSAFTNIKTINEAKIYKTNLYIYIYVDIKSKTCKIIITCIIRGLSTGWSGRFSNRGTARWAFPKQREPSTSRGCCNFAETTYRSPKFSFISSQAGELMIFRTLCLRVSCWRAVSQLGGNTRLQRSSRRRKITKKEEEETTQNISRWGSTRLQKVNSIHFLYVLVLIHSCCCLWFYTVAAVLRSALRNVLCPRLSFRLPLRWIAELWTLTQLTDGDEGTVQIFTLHL